MTGRLDLCVIALAFMSAARPAMSGPEPVRPSPPASQTDQPALSQPVEPKTESPPATPPAAQPEAKPETGPAAPAPVAAIKADETVSILGKKVRGPDGKDVMGTVIDVLVDADGRPRAAIIDFGGFLGVGSRKIAVDWQLLKFKPADHDASIALSMDRAQIQAAPEYKDSTQPAQVVEPPVPPPAAEAVTPPPSVSTDAGPKAN